MRSDRAKGSLASIGAGHQDGVWRKVARNLREAGRGNSIVRVGWESNLADWRWRATRGNADQYRAAYRPNFAEPSWLAWSGATVRAYPFFPGGPLPPVLTKTDNSGRYTLTYETSSGQQQGAGDHIECG